MVTGIGLALEWDNMRSDLAPPFTNYVFLGKFINSIDLSFLHRTMGIVLKWKFKIIMHVNYLVWCLVYFESSVIVIYQPHHHFYLFVREHFQSYLWTLLIRIRVFHLLLACCVNSTKWLSWKWGTRYMPMLNLKNLDHKGCYY